MDRVPRFAEAVIDCTVAGPSKTRQEFRDECDINWLMERFARTGILVDPSLVGKREAAFGDFSGAQDFTENQDRLVAAANAFDTLPGVVRERFNQDPARVLEFLADESNREEAISLGFIEKPTVAPPVIAGGAPTGEATVVASPEGAGVVTPSGGDGGSAGST